MGISKSYFGTPYNLDAIDFGMSERRNAASNLEIAWLKDPKKIELLTSGLYFQDPTETMVHLSKLIFNQMCDSYEWPKVETARESAKRFRMIYNLCINIDGLDFLKGSLLLKAVIGQLVDPNSLLRQDGLVDSQDEEFYKMSKFLFVTYHAGGSIYTTKCQNEFKEEFNF